MPDASTRAVTLGEAATLDLNGFAITGVTSCSGTPTTCTDTGTGAGVLTGRSAVVRNGIIRKMGSHGIQGDDGTRVHDVLIEQCGAGGIQGGLGSNAWEIDGVRIRTNGGAGISLAFGAGGRGSVIRNSQIFRNGNDGVEGTGLLLTGNHVMDNAGLGFRLNFVDGISAFGGNALIGNNGGNANPQTSGDIQMGTNVCGNDTTCPRGVRSCPSSLASERVSRFWPPSPRGSAPRPPAPSTACSRSTRPASPRAASRATPRAFP